jgi:hypothetical protein
MSVFRRVAAFTVAAALSSIATPPAFGANGVFGGSTSAAEAIVITTDAKVKKLRSAVIAWDAACQDGRSFALASALTPVKPDIGFSPGPDDLVISLNGKGRFIGMQLTARDLGEQTASSPSSCRASCAVGRPPRGSWRRRSRSSTTPAARRS